jgi:DNA-directed RNA polymerase subunit RPC12/RpoP
VAARKTVKTSIRCLNCGKTFSNNKKGPVFGLCYTCRTNLNADANDFDLQLLLPQKQSEKGAALVVADINNDGLDDFFIGIVNMFESEI